MVVVPESTIVAKGRLGPGQMIAVDLDEGVVLEDRAVKDRIAGEADYAAMTGAFLTIADLPRSRLRHALRPPGAGAAARSRRGRRWRIWS